MTVGWSCVHSSIYFTPLPDLLNSQRSHSWPPPARDTALGLRGTLTPKSLFPRDHLTPCQILDQIFQAPEAPGHTSLVKDERIFRTEAAGPSGPSTLQTRASRATTCVLPLEVQVPGLPPCLPRWTAPWRLLGLFPRKCWLGCPWHQLCMRVCVCSHVLAFALSLAARGESGHHGQGQGEHGPSHSPSGPEATGSPGDPDPGTAQMCWAGPGPVSLLC